MGRRSSTRDDFDRVKDANHQLRTENRNLRKENARLKKELSKLDSYQFDRQIELDEDYDATFVPVDNRTEEKFKCPKCKSQEFTQISAGMYIINICQSGSCGYRKRSKLKVD